MTEPAMNSGTSQVETGYRMRRITREPVCLNFFEKEDMVINFDNFALLFEGNNYSYDFKIKLVSGHCNPPFYLNQSSDPWKVEAKLFSRRAEDKTKVIAEFLLSLSNEKTSVDYNMSAVGDQLVVMDLEFVELNGLSVESLRDYTVANKYSDVTIVVEEQKFELNKVFLASQSSYFEKLLFGDFAEKNQKEIELKDVSVEAFTDLLDVLTLSMHQLHRKDAIFAILKLADMLDVPLVIKRIENMLLMYPGLRALNIAEKLWAADKYGMKMVLMHVMSTWTVDNSDKYLTEELWNDLKPATTLHLHKTLLKQIQEK